jgi:TolA-binding protein
MSNLSKKLTNLRSQVQQLDKTFNELRLKNENLVTENKRLQEKLEQKLLRIKTLKEERDLIINAKSLKDVGLSSNEARHKINELVRGIDKCIAQLNQ